MTKDNGKSIGESIGEGVWGCLTAVIGVIGLILLVGAFFVGVLPFCKDIFLKVGMEEGYRDVNIGFEQLTVFLLFIIAMLLSAIWMAQDGDG